MVDLAQCHYLTPRQTARALGVHVSYVRRLERTGRLPATWTPLGRLFDAALIEKLCRDRAARQETQNPSR